MEIKGNNITPKMSKRKRANAVLAKLCFSKHGPAVNYQHIARQIAKIKDMEAKGVK